MARRQMAERQFTQVAMPNDSMAGVMNTIAGTADGVNKLLMANARADAEMKLADAKIEIDNLTKEYQLTNELNPASNFDAFKQQRQKILDTYSKSINPFARKDWLAKTQMLTKQNDSQQGQWALAQTYKNTISAVNKGMQSALTTAYQNGEDFALGKIGSRDELNKNFENSYSELMSLGSDFLGEERTKKELEKFKADYMKSVISGAISANPEKGLSMLDDEGVKNDINDPDAIKSLKSYASVRQAQIKKELDISNLEIGQSLIADLIAEDKPYYVIMNELQQRVNAGGLDQGIAVAGIKYLNSVKGVLPQPDEMVEHNILEAIASTNSLIGGRGTVPEKETAQDFLKRTADIEQMIVNGLADGDLSKKQAQDLRKQMISHRDAVAVEGIQQGWFNEFRGVKDYYKKDQSFPDIYMVRAVKQYFLETEGKNLSKKEKRQIRDDIAREMRQEQLSALSGIQTFKTIEEAQNANLKSGDEFILNGKRLRVK